MVPKRPPRAPGRRESDSQPRDYWTQRCDARAAAGRGHSCQHLHGWGGRCLRSGNVRRQCRRGPHRRHGSWGRWARCRAISVWAQRGSPRSRGRPTSPLAPVRKLGPRRRDRLPWHDDARRLLPRPARSRTRNRRGARATGDPLATSGAAPDGTAGPPAHSPSPPLADRLVDHPDESWERPEIPTDPAHPAPICWSAKGEATRRDVVGDAVPRSRREDAQRHREKEHDDVGHDKCTDWPIAASFGLIGYEGKICSQKRTPDDEEARVHEPDMDILIVFGGVESAGRCQMTSRC